MAAAEIISNLITNDETIPRVYNDVASSSGQVRIMSATFEATTDFDATDIAAICKLPAAASVKAIRWFGDNLATGQAHVGLYTGPNSANLTAADADCYAATFDFGTGANTTGVNLAFATKNIANINKRVYEDAGDNLGEFSEYWLCLTCHTEDFAAGTLAFVVEYVID
jgi:hypothetical protein